MAESSSVRFAGHSVIRHTALCMLETLGDNDSFVCVRSDFPLVTEPHLFVPVSLLGMLHISVWPITSPWSVFTGAVADVGKPKTLECCHLVS